MEVAVDARVDNDHLYDRIINGDVYEFEKILEEQVFAPTRLNSETLLVALDAFIRRFAAVLARSDVDSFVELGVSIERIIPPSNKDFPEIIAAFRSIVRLTIQISNWRHDPSVMEFIHTNQIARTLLKVLRERKRAKWKELSDVLALEFTDGSTIYPNTLNRPLQRLYKGGLVSKNIDNTYCLTFHGQEISQSLRSEKENALGSQDRSGPKLFVLPCVERIDNSPEVQTAPSARRATTRI